MVETLAATFVAVTAVGSEAENEAAHRYVVDVDPSVPNNAHSIALGFVGFDRDVLEVGAGAGHVTAVLAARGNRVTAVDIDPVALGEAAPHAVAVHAGDLDVTPLDELVGPGPFDVVLLGDVVEHLRDPVAALRAARRVLRPGGAIVVSVPNVAHIDLRLHLFIGRWQYQPTGLLDATHLRFFTRSTLEDMLTDAGLRIVALERVFWPVFSSGLNVGPGDVDRAIIDQLLLDPEAETLQFVVHAKRIEDQPESAELEHRLVEANELVQRSRRDAQRSREREIELLVELDAVNVDRQRLVREISALHRTRVFRYTARLRGFYSRLRVGR